MTTRLAFVLVATLQILVVVAISPISVKGTKFFDDEGQQFFVKGVAYQPGGASDIKDPLADTNQCQLDAGFMKDLGANTVRVYTVDPTLNHDGCMQALASQCMYLWVDLQEPLHSFNRADPEWTMELFDHFTSVVDAFASYNNTLVFTVANEVINDVDTLQAAPYVKAATRDVKAFRDARGYRKIPIAYSSADIVSIQSVIASYFACGEEADTIDVFGLNTFSWCGNSSYSVSGYDTLYTQLQPLNIPAVFTETGCNTIKPRTFEEVSVMLGSVFPNAFSGAIVYEWSEEASGYGLVEYPSNSSSDGFPSPLADYDNLQEVFSRVKPASTSKADYTPSNTQPACPTTDSSWSIDGAAALPTIAELKINTVTARTTYIDAAAVAADAAAPSSSGSQLGTTSGGNTVFATDTGTDTVSEDRGLSTGAIAGIAVGGAAVGFALLTGVAFLLYRKRQRAQLVATTELQKGQPLGSPSDGDYDSHSATTKPELSGISAGRRIVPKQELDGNETSRRYNCGAATTATFPGSRNVNVLPSELDAHPRRTSGEAR